MKMLFIVTSGTFFIRFIINCYNNNFYSQQGKKKTMCSYGILKIPLVLLLTYYIALFMLSFAWWGEDDGI